MTFPNLLPKVCGFETLLHQITFLWQDVLSIFVSSRKVSCEELVIAGNKGHSWGNWSPFYDENIVKPNKSKFLVLTSALTSY